MINVSADDIHKIVTDPNGAETLVKAADQAGKELSDMKLTTSQIRSLFGEVRQIEAEWGMGNEHRGRALRRLILLKPKMAYRSRKERGQAVKALVDLLRPAVDEVIKEKDEKKQDEAFGRLVEFFEAILAYHKAYGGI
jgi:CRISPR-associated protein Csm2